MTYKSPEERMKVSKRRSEVEATGKPIYTSYAEVPQGLYSPTQCKKIKKSVKDMEEVSAWVLNRNWNGYLPLYHRKILHK